MISDYLATSKFPPEKFQVPEDKKTGPSQPAQPPGPKKILLNSADQLYSEIRDLNFLAVGPVLSRKAKQISAAFEVGLYVFVLVCAPWRLLWWKSPFSTVRFAARDGTLCLLEFTVVTFCID